MFISKAKKYHQNEDGSIVAYPYYRLTKSFRDATGVKRNRSVLCLGSLDGFTDSERGELADLLTAMIEKGEYVMHESPSLTQAAMEFYVKYRDNGYDYITVLPSGENKFKASSDHVIRHEDSRYQEIRLQAGTVVIDGESRKALLVDSDAKAIKERSIYEQACQHYEEGLELVKAGIEKKGGTKKRDAVNRRLGKLDEKYGAIRKSFVVDIEYDGKDKDEKAIAINWKRNDEKVADVKSFHGKYVLLTSLDENNEVNIWKFYNVIRTVEETFHILKTDLDIRPVYHKTDDGIKAHLNLAVLAYWIVSVTKYKLKVKGYENVRWDEIMRIASTQVAVTARIETENGDIVSIRQSTVPEDKLSLIYSLLGVNPQTMRKEKSVVHPIKVQKNEPPGKQ